MKERISIFLIRKGMFSMKKILVLLLGFGLLQACTSENSNKEVSQEENREIGDNSRNSLDWEGLYAGVVPCADCEGINTMLSLKDSLFVLRTYYLGRESHPTHTTGTFSWSNDGGSIILSGIDDGPTRFKVGENRLFQLDMEGNAIESTLKNKYILIKVDIQLLDSTWELTQLEGKPVENTEGKPITLTFDGHQIHVKGFAGCNNYGGGFILSEEELKFSQLFSTEMACSNLDIESKYLKILNETNRYSINNDELILKKDDKHLAVFRKGN